MVALSESWSIQIVYLIENVWLSCMPSKPAASEAGLPPEKACLHTDFIKGKTIHPPITHSVSWPSEGIPD